MRSILYRFPDLRHFAQMVEGVGETELELGLPAGEEVEDGEWVLAIFELGAARRATSAAARGSVGPDGACLVFEPRDWRRVADFAETEAHRPVATRSAPPGTRTASSKPPRDDGASRTPLPRGRPTDETTAVPETAKSASTPTGVTASSCVLVVDDDPDIRDVVSAMLEAVGLEVRQAESAEDALTRVHEEHIDLMVLDWNLPKMTGLDLCRVIRKQPGLSTLPVLFLTANASSQDMVDAFASGADDYVVKPFRAPELGARIFSLLRRARMNVG